MLSIREILGQNGPLAKHVSGFAPRVEQQAMSEAVAQTLEKGSVLIAEAGTGTGKTFAYLVPAILSGRKIIISTGTKNLQDQLFHRDLPVVRDALGVPVTVALLKGRNNYLCMHRLDLAEDGRYTDPQLADKIQKIRRWSAETIRGDLAELNVVSESDPVWGRVTSSTDNCLGQDCQYFDKCHLIEARRQAQAADIVVVNHHLLFADMALREDGFGELLPAADAFIIDEAHQLPDVASNFFGISMSSHQMIELARDAESEYLAEINEGHEFQQCTDKLQKSVQDLRLSFGPSTGKGTWQDYSDTPSITRDIEEVLDNLAELESFLKPLAERSKGLDTCLKRCSELLVTFTSLTGSAPADYIHWCEIHKRSFSIHLTPLSIAASFQSQLESMKAAWVFTSATLAVADKFDLFQQQLGLTDAITEQWESPFDFPNQGLFYVPKGLPMPNEKQYTQAVIDYALPVIEASGGRTFMLFTSHRALAEAASILEDEIDYPLLVQGDAPRDMLLDRFRKAGNAVLLGASSFWEGVDVRGEALSCVIIDKLPFASPGDPVLQGRIEAMRKQGNNPFMHYQLPNAVITLKQGAGRLIRDVNDYGVLMIMDPRLLGKSYGRIFLNSLPAMARTRDIKDVELFFDRINEAVAS
ncbi:MAG: ATP-dependent DNA helicase [Gammaproteobacteria bacterium]|nr:ATP-dependent DNA helicase [Gammaproteobacteria bacterium]